MTLLKLKKKKKHLANTVKMSALLLLFLGLVVTGRTGVSTSNS